MIRKINSWILLTCIVATAMVAIAFSFVPSTAPAADPQTKPTTNPVESADAKFIQARRELAELYSQISYLKAKLGGTNASDAGQALEKLMVVNDLLVRYQADLSKLNKDAVDRAETLQTQMIRLNSDNTEQTSRLKSHADELAEKVRVAEAAVAQTQTQIAQLQTERDGLKALLESSEASANARANQLQVAAEKANSDQTTMSQLLADYKKLQQDRDAIASKLAELSKSGDENARAAADKLATTEKTLADMQVQMKKAETLAAENERLQTLVTASDKTIANLQENVRKLESAGENERKGLTEKLSDAAQTNKDQLDAANAKVAAIESKLREIVAANERTVAEMKTQLDQLRDAATAARSNQIAEFQKLLATVQEENSRLTNRLQETQERLQQAQAKISQSDKLAAGNAEHDKVVTELKSQIEQLYQAVGDARAQAQANEKRATDAEEKLKAVSANPPADTNSILAGQVVNTPTENYNAAMESKLATLQEAAGHRTAMLIAENQMLRQVNDKQRAELQDALRWSKSSSQLKNDLIAKEARSGLKTANERIAELENVLAGLYTSYSSRLAELEEEKTKLLNQIEELRQASGYQISKATAEFQKTIIALEEENRRLKAKVEPVNQLESNKTPSPASNDPSDKQPKISAMAQ